MEGRLYNNPWVVTHDDNDAIFSVIKLTAVHFEESNDTYDIVLRYARGDIFTLNYSLLSIALKDYDMIKERLLGGWV